MNIDVDKYTYMLCTAVKVHRNGGDMDILLGMGMGMGMDQLTPGGAGAGRGESARTQWNRCSQARAETPKSHQAPRVPKPLTMRLGGGSWPSTPTLLQQPKIRVSILGLVQ